MLNNVDKYKELPDLIVCKSFAYRNLFKNANLWPGGRIEGHTGRQSHQNFDVSAAHERLS